ncbi:MAG TPA: hypothetical protein ENN23_05200 [Deltaproteobacteria bacterium]|nr:hypothetical protein [Deltaproteobacteria bacterium]
MIRCKKILNDRGISLVEALIAAFLAMVAIVALMPMQSMSVRTGFKADYLGRAALIMQARLEAEQYKIMNRDIDVDVTGTNPVCQSITVSGSSGLEGDATFEVCTSINPYDGEVNAWLVNVRVTWLGGPAGGINSSIVATRIFNFHK